MSQSNGDYFTKMVMSIIVYTVIAAVAVAGIMWLTSLVGGKKEMDSVQKEAIGIRLQASETVSVVGDKKEMSAPAAAVKAEPVVLTGESIVKTTCFACHGTGILESPKIGDAAAWQARIDANGGLDGLVQSGITGKGAMPPKGGNPNLTDAQMKEAVEFMMQ